MVRPMMNVIAPLALVKVIKENAKEDRGKSHRKWQHTNLTAGILIKSQLENAKSSHWLTNYHLMKKILSTKKSRQKQD